LVFAVCAPAANDALLGGGILDRFGDRLADLRTFRFVSLDAALARIHQVAASGQLEQLH